MPLILLSIGLLAIFISTYFFKDWASGIVGFIYVSMLYGAILVFKNLFEMLLGWNLHIKIYVYCQNKTDYLNNLIWWYF